MLAQNIQSPDAQRLQKALGTHILLELQDCPEQLLLDQDLLEALLVDSAKKAGATVVKSVFHQFSPHGLSGVVVIAESHITVHTWPEHGYAAVDIFTCGDEAIADRIRAEVCRRFEPATSSHQTVMRGPNISQSLIDRIQ